MKKILLVIILILITGLLVYKKISNSDIIKIDLPEAKIHQEFVDDNTIEGKVNLKIENIIKKPEEVIIKEKNVKKDIEITKINNINLAVPFTSQAPTANWKQPYQDTCEEASLLMVDYYYQNKKIPSPEDVEKILSSMVVWQEDNWGGYFNLPVAKLAEYIKLFYNYKVEIIKDVSTEQLKSFLNQGLPIIVPANGHKLDNPFFSNDGPDYHMLVIKGYVDNNFITNDPGTKRGEDFIYTYKNMMESIADWDIKKSSATGPRNVLVLYNN